MLATGRFEPVRRQLSRPKYSIYETAGMLHFEVSSKRRIVFQRAGFSHDAFVGAIVAADIKPLVRTWEQRSI
jgi:hypothetical protein